MRVGKQEASTDSRLQWLDEELRATKAALQKVEHELEQALSQGWNLGSGLRKLEEKIGDADAAAAALPGIREDIRELRTQAGRLQDRQNTLAAQGEEISRAQQADVQRERQEMSALLKQAETAARTVDQFQSRVQRLEEALRHVEEEVAGARLSHETLSRDMADIRNRGARNLESALHLEHQVEALAGEIEALQKRDDELAEKVNLYEEKVHRQGDRMEKFEGHLKLPLEIKEQLDRGRFERQQLTERLTKLESHADQLTEHTAEYVQGLSRIDQRTQGQAARLLEMAEELQQQREAVAGQLQRLVRTMERQRRRQAEALAQEIKELKRSEFKTEQ